MKICIVGDVHWSTYSSIVRSRGTRFSTRLENLIATINWCERFANDCDAFVYLGDFFDKCDLTSEELTALQEVKWAKDKPHYFVVGNHESPVASLEFNSTKALQKEGFTIITEPLTLFDKLVFIPYTLEENRKLFADYVGSVKDAIVFSHNDLKGIRYGAYESKTGFELNEIHDKCKLFINGHLHNQMKFMDESGRMYAINLGNITGQNFSEDASIYNHQVMLLDTDTYEFKLLTNPFAMNFYKFDIDKESDLKKLDLLGPQPVLSIKCEESLQAPLNEVLDSLQGVITSKVCYYSTATDGTVELGTESLQTIDHLEKFKQFVIEKLGKTDVVIQELAEVCK